MPISDKCTPFRITRARLVDGTGSAPLDDAVVCVGEDGTITYAGAAAAAPDLAPSDEEVVDVGGRTVLPGFIDCHVHLAFESARDIAMRYAIDPDGRGLPDGRPAAAYVARGRDHGP